METTSLGGRQITTKSANKKRCKSLRASKPVKSLACRIIALSLLSTTSHAVDSFTTDITDIKASSTIKLATTKMAPYQVYKAQKTLSGTGIDAIRCIEKHSGLRFKIDVFPWKRAQELVAIGEYDGFFVGSRNEERDRYATFVGPLLHSFWHWYTLKSQEIDLSNEGKPNDKHKSVGAVLGTNMYSWISKDQTYNVVTSEDSNKLFKLLDAGRIDYLLATGAMYERYLQSVNSSQEFNVVIAKSKPLGLYINDQFAIRQPMSFELIQKGAKECSPPSISK